MKKLGLIIVFLFSMVASGKDGTSNDYIAKAKEHYDKGKEHSLKGEYSKANEEFKKAEEILSKGKYEEKVSSRHLSLGTDKNIVVQQIIENAKKASLRSSPQEAIKYYLDLLNFAPDNPDIYYNLGVEYLKKYDYFDAVQEFMHAIRLNPRDADACYNLGILYEIFLNDKKMAVFYYKKYLDINPHARDRKIVEEWIDGLERKK